MRLPRRIPRHRLRSTRCEIQATPSDKCELSGYADGIIPRTLSGSYRHWKTYGSVSHRISSDCEPGPYKIRLTLTHSSCSEDNGQCTDSKTFHVSVSPPTATPTNTRRAGRHRHSNATAATADLRVDRHGRPRLPTPTATATADGHHNGRPQRRQQPPTPTATIQGGGNRAATRYSPTRPRRQPRHRQQRVSCSSGNSKYQRCPQPRLQPRLQPRRQLRRLQQRQHKAAATKVAATTRATTKAATTVAKTKATTRVAASSHLSATRHHHRHRRNSSRRRP